jgi:hypothetical protein
MEEYDAAAAAAAARTVEFEHHSAADGSSGACMACPKYRQLIKRAADELRRYRSTFRSLEAWLDADINGLLRKLQALEYLRRQANRLGRPPDESEVMELASSLRDAMETLHQEFEGDMAAAAMAMLYDDDGRQHLFQEMPEEGSEEPAPMKGLTHPPPPPPPPILPPPSPPPPHFSTLNEPEISPAVSPVSSHGLDSISTNDADMIDLTSSSASGESVDN